MTHEFKTIVESYRLAKKKGLKSVLASVVDLDGSSYRKPGVRMLILEDTSMVGAVSGGCVEKDILRQSKSVFKSQQASIMTYDGRYRLGCEGILYILLEPFNPSDEFLNIFDNSIKERNPFELTSYYRKEEGVFKGIGTEVTMLNISYSLSSSTNLNIGANENLLFTQLMPPCFKLIIFGAEHDTVQLSKMAGLMGWEVSVITGPSEHKTINDFPGATNFISTLPDAIDVSQIDNQTAIMIMTHSFTNDLKALIKLSESSPAYLGVLGPVHKRENLIDQLLSYAPNMDERFLDRIHGPAGLDIGSETPQEIVISIISEILAITRDRKPIPLKEKTGDIHAKH